MPRELLSLSINTLHRVIEEVLQIARKVSGATAYDVVKEISKIHGLVLIESDAVLAFAERYTKLSDKLHLRVNDALRLQLMLDAGLSNCSVTISSS